MCVLRVWDWTVLVYVQLVFYIGLLQLHKTNPLALAFIIFKYSTLVTTQPTMQPKRTFTVLHKQVM